MKYSIFLFSGSLSVYAQICDKSVLKRLLKELWKIVIRSLEKNIVLPPVTDRSVSIYENKIVLHWSNNYKVIEKKILRAPI